MARTQRTDLSRIRLLVLDADGVLTDGRTYVDESGNQALAFYVHDGSTIKLWRRSGGAVAIVSGRRLAALQHRARELAIEVCELGVADKGAAYERIVRQAGVTDDEVCYVGDDWADLAPMRQAGFAVAVANAREEVRRAADWVTTRPGGHGAVSEVIEHVLTAQGRWSEAVRTVGALLD